MHPVWFEVQVCNLWLYTMYQGSLMIQRDAPWRREDGNKNGDKKRPPVEAARHQVMMRIQINVGNGREMFMLTVLFFSDDVIL